MDENYLRIVRNSLYKNPKENQNKRRFVFPTEYYKSENAFESPPKKEDASKKIKNRKSTPHVKKMSKKEIKIQIKKNGIKASVKRKKSLGKIKKKSKKPKLMFTSSSSGLSDLNLFSTTSDDSDLLDFDSDVSDSNKFDIDRFFETRNEPSSETTCEAHSGIENEFVSEYAKHAKIINGKFSCKPNDRLAVKIEKESLEDSEKDEEPVREPAHDAIEEIGNKNDRELNSKSNKEYEWKANDSRDLSIDFESEYEKCEACNDVQEKLNIATIDDDDDNVKDTVNVTTKAENASDFQEFDVEDYKIVVLTENSCVPFHGMCTLQVLHGEIEIIGGKLNKCSGLVNVYSSRGTSLLFVKNITDYDEETNLSTLLSNTKLNSANEQIVTQKTAVIKCTKLFDKGIVLAEKYISQQIFPKLSPNKPQIIFNPKDNWNVLNINKNWNNLLEVVKPCTKLFIAGGKGVGKSTFLRYAINKLLEKYEEIRVIDLDPGQSEFYVPGSVYVLNVKEKIFGPNYTHLKKPERTILSNINPGHDPASYVKTVQLLMEYVAGLDKNIPTLINYMGFTKDIGLKIISSCLTFIRPTDVVQIISKSQQKNFPQDIIVENVREHCDYFGGDCRDLKFVLHQIEAMNENYAGWNIEPRVIRDICVLAYLGQMMSHNVNSLTRHDLPMFETKLSLLEIRSLQNEELSPAAINANLVALCEKNNFEDNSVLFNCYGYGIVRGIDLVNDKIVLMTPEPLEGIKNLNTLVLGSVSLPPSVYMTPDAIKGSIPYVMEGPLVSLGQTTKRSYLPANKK